MSLADAKGELARMAQLSDADIDLAEAGLVLAALDHPRRDRQPYRSLLAEMTAALAERTLNADVAADRAAGLAAVLAGRYRLVGDEDEDEPDSTNLMRLLDRRRGAATILGLVWLHLGRRQGWAMAPLAFPGRLLLRLDGAEGSRAILDPCAEGRCLQAADLRELLKAASGSAAELEPSHYAALSNRDLLVRLQTAVKLHHLRHAQLPRAVATVEATLLFAPDQANLWREAGLMHLRQGDLPRAIRALEQFVARAPNSTARHRTSALLQELRQKLT